jgi:2-desacetyl-2-hydroxyethyl bacteriochlorophyllide A dehydrogenase
VKAVVAQRAGRLALLDVDAPRPGGRVLVRVDQAGLCGTDLKIFHGVIPVEFPRILGHEVTGHVVAAGESGRIRVGDRVLVDPSWSCGHCRLCQRGRGYLCRDGGLIGRDCDGGLAELVAVEESRLLKIPPAVSDDEAALLQVLGTCVHAQRLVQAFPVDAAAVVGLGVTGLLHLQLLRLRGLSAVVGVSRSAGKRRLGMSLGAAVTAGPAEEASEAVRALTGGHGADLVVEAAGTAGTVRLAIELAAPGATVLVFGTITGDESLPCHDLYHKELRLVSARAATAGDYQDAIDLVSAGRIQAGPLITSRLPFDEAQRAFDSWGSEPANLKTVLYAPTS